MAGRTTAALLLGAAVFFGMGLGRAQAPQRPSESVQDERAGQADISYKLCAAVSLRPFWRDTIPVPGNWTIEDCREHVHVSFGSPVQHQLGCAFGTGRPLVSWSGIGTPGSVPARNCGWGRG